MNIRRAWLLLLAAALAAAGWDRDGELRFGGGMAVAADEPPAPELRIPRNRMENFAGEQHSVAFSPDGKILASGCEDKTIKLWDVATGQEKATLKGQSGFVKSVAFSPDGKTLASGSTDNTVKLWDPATGKERATLKKYKFRVWSVSFSPDGKTLAAAASWEAIGLWDVDTRKEKVSLISTRGALSVSWSPDGKTLASGSEEAMIKLWDVSPEKGPPEPTGRNVNGRLAPSASSQEDQT